MTAGTGRPRRRLGPLDDERRPLAADYYPLARSIAARYAAIAPDRAADLISQAGLSLVRAARGYSPDLGRFATFARWRIAHDLARLLGQGRGRIVHRGAFAQAPDLAARGDFERVDHRDEVDVLLRGVSPRSAEVLRRLYLAGSTTTEAGDAMGLSQKSVSRIHRSFLIGA